MASGPGGSGYKTPPTVNVELNLPEALVLIIVTGGTICMKKSDRGLGMYVYKSQVCKVYY